MLGKPHGIFDLNDSDRAVGSFIKRVDAFCAATAPVYANDPYDPSKPRPFMLAKSRANVKVDYNAVDDKFEMVATKTIHHGEEILYHYGSDYWPKAKKDGRRKR